MICLSPKKGQLTDFTGAALGSKNSRAAKRCCPNLGSVPPKDGPRENLRKTTGKVGKP